MATRCDERTRSAFDSDRDGDHLDYSGPLIAGMAIGAISASAICLVYSLVFELLVLTPLTVSGIPHLSYGQQWGLAFAIVAMLGALAGLALFVGWSLRMRWLIIVPPIAALAALRFAIVLWKDSVVRYGIQPSDQIVYVPMIFSSVTLLVLSPVAMVTALFRTFWARRLMKQVLDELSRIE